MKTAMGSLGDSLIKLGYEDLVGAFLVESL
jgi:hypothetical protein